MIYPRSAFLRIPVISCLLLYTVCTGIWADTAGTDNVIGRVWLQRSVDLMNPGDVLTVDWMDVLTAVETAAEFTEPDSDSRYIRAQVLLSGEIDRNISGYAHPVREAYRLLALSLSDSSGGDIVPFTDKAVAWSGTALRLHDYRNLIDTYSEWPLGHRYDPVLIYAASRASLYLGYEDDAAGLAWLGESLVQNSTDLSILSPAFGGPALPRFRALAVAAGDEEALSTLSAAARWGESLDNALVPWILSGYINTGSEGFPVSELGGNTEALHRLFNGSTDTVPEVFRYDLALMHRLRDASRQLEPDFNATDYLASTIEADSEYDGFVEERIVILGDNLYLRTIDADQDGVHEWFISYENGTPLQIIAGEGQLTVNYAAGSWPEVMSMVSREDSTVVELSFHPGSYIWAPLTDDVLWDKPAGRPIPDAAYWESVSRVIAVQDFPSGYDLATETGSGDSRGRAVTFLSGGYPVLAREFRYLGNNSSSLLWTRELVYEEGVISAGRRSYKKDADSGKRLWEIYERYENGVLVGLAWDPGMIGSPAYLKDWALSRVLEVQAWDIDGDAWIDYRRFVFPDNRESSAELLVTEADSDDLIPWSVSDWYPWDN